MIVLPGSIDPGNLLGLPLADDFLYLAPADAGTLVVDLDFSNAAGYTLSGGNLATVVNLAGSGTIAITGAIAHGAAVGTKDGITISGTGQLLNIGPPLSPRPSWSAVALVNVATTLPQAIGAVVVDNGAINNSNGFGFYASPKPGGYAYVVNAPGHTVAERAATTLSTPYGAAVVAASVTTGQAYMYANAVKVFESTDISVKTNDGAIRVGAYSSSQFPATMVLSRLLIYSTALTKSQLERLSRSLAEDAGITV